MAHGLAGDAGRAVGDAQAHLSRVQNERFHMMKIEVESFPEDDGSKPIVLKTDDGECVVVEQGEAVIVFCLIAQAILLVAGD